MERVDPCERHDGRPPFVVPVVGATAERHVCAIHGHGNVGDATSALELRPDCPKHVRWRWCSWHEDWSKHLYDALAEVSHIRLQRAVADAGYVSHHAVVGAAVRQEVHAAGDLEHCGDLLRRVAATVVGDVAIAALSPEAVLTAAKNADKLSSVAKNLSKDIEQSGDVLNAAARSLQDALSSVSNLDDVNRMRTTLLITAG